MISSRINANKANCLCNFSSQSSVTRSPLRLKRNVPHHLRATTTLPQQQSLPSCSCVCLVFLLLLLLRIHRKRTFCVWFVCLEDRPNFRSSTQSTTLPTWSPATETVSDPRCSRARIPRQTSPAFARVDAATTSPPAGTRRRRRRRMRRCVYVYTFVFLCLFVVSAKSARLC